jgi:hypothetical protein
VSVTHSDLADWLLHHETAADPGTASEAVAVEHICGKLIQPVSRLVSSDGSRAILSRALHLARADFPFLEGVRAGIEPEACFVGLEGRLGESQAGAALLAVLRYLLSLLVGFIGEDLTVRVVREVWTDIPLSPSSGTPPTG